MILPENALASVSKWKKRVVGIDGTLQYNGKTYEVKGLYDADVYVYEGVFEDKLVVQDTKTGLKYEVERFKPLTLGEYRAHPETPHEKAIKEARALTISSIHHAKPDKGNIIDMPIKTKEERRIEDPFDIEHFANIEAAMVHFTALMGTFISKEEREMVETLISKNNLRKSYVLDLAAGLKKRLHAAQG
ncbi:MAG: hypothetical protein HQK98_06900 [Nitrospirae bacterium]|nr:hypothetical protein [Nitrospirota bacterium]